MSITIPAWIIWTFCGVFFLFVLIFAILGFVLLVNWKPPSW